MEQQEPDRRIAYGAMCTWWDAIANVSANDAGLPCCPHCRGVLFEVETEEEWWAGADHHEAAGHPGYVAMIRWARGRCFPNFPALEQAYALTEPTRGDP